MPELDWGELLWIFFAACLVNNFTLSYFLGLCPFLGVSGRIDTALRMGMANIFVMTRHLASAPGSSTPSCCPTRPTCG